MGTKRYSETPLPGYYIMRDLNEDARLSSWPLFYGDNTVTNGHYCNVPMPGSLIDGYSTEDKHSLKQKMVEHEAVFKNQVCELHRLYRIQRDMMEHAQKKEQCIERASVEPSCSSNIHRSQPEEDARKKWHMAGFHLQDTGHNRTSVLGVEMSDSPVICTKQDNTKPDWFPFRNGSTPRNCQVFESRPSKVRKKLLDLQLPADAYVDVEEDDEITVQKISAYDLNHNPEPFYGNRSIERNDLAINGQASSSRSRSIFGFADLNEPVKNDEAAFDFLGSTSINGGNKGMHDKPIRSNAGYIGGADTTLDVGNGFLMKSYTQTKVSEKGWHSNINEAAGSSKNSIDSLSQSCHPYKLPVSSSPTVQASLSQLHHGPEQYQTGSGMRDFGTDIHCHGLNSVARNHVPSYGNNMKPIAYCPPGSYSFFGSWAQSVPPLEKPNDDVVQRVNAFESSSISSFKHLLPYPQNQEMKWQVKADPSLNGGYHESWSELNKREHLPFACFDYLNCNGNHYAASDQMTNHASGKIFCSSYEDPKPGMVVNSKAVLLEDRTVMAENNGFKDHPSPLPWLKPIPNHRATEAGESTRLVFSGESSYSQAASKHWCWKNERVRDLNHPSSGDCEILIKNDTSRRVQKIMGTPIFGTVVPEIEPSSNISTSTKSTNNKRKNIMIDINVECEPDESIYAEEPITEKENQKNCASIRERDYIDLNSCASDFENPPLDFENKSTKARLLIDLEAPASMESDEDDATPSENKDVQTQDEVLKTAAEIIIAISSSCPQNHVAYTLSDNPLLLFADAIVSSREEELTVKDDDSSDEIDLFEAMTLQLKETKEEDYMPKRRSTIPQIEKVEDVKLPNRPRRGQARRGRQRKDFQRDILPGLTSLSRHEVTEDIQTFGGLMKASGHSWHSRMTRKNGGARGRSRGTVVVRNPICTRSMRQKIGSGGACLDERSLTGWGKTTRRPRRQRWNHQTVVLTLDDAMEH